jgi:hypothetical protein
MNTPLVNRSAVKKMALQLSKDNRAGKFTRVSAEFLERVNSATDAYVRQAVQSHPSVGKTLV